MMADIVPYLERVRARFEEPEMQATFRGFNKTLQFIFPDLQRNFTLTIAADGSATLAEQTAPQADIKVTTSIDMLADILDRKLNPTNAFITLTLKLSHKIYELF